MNTKEIVIVPLFRVMGNYNGQKVQLTSNIASRNIAERLMKEIALIHLEITDLYIEEYKEFLL